MPIGLATTHLSVDQICNTHSHTHAYMQTCCMLQIRFFFRFRVFTTNLILSAIVKTADNATTNVQLVYKPLEKQIK